MSKDLYGMTLYLKKTKSIPRAPDEGASSEVWDVFYNKYLDLLMQHYSKVTNRDRLFTVIHPEDIWKVAEYWYITKPQWIKLLTKRYPTDSFNTLWRTVNFATHGEERQLWMMFLSFGFHPAKGPTGQEIKKTNKLPHGLPEDTPIKSEIESFHYPKGIINPKHVEDIKYVWRSIDFAIHLHRYRTHSGMKVGKQPELIAYHMGMNVAAQYDSMLPMLLFRSDMPGMPKELGCMFYKNKWMQRTYETKKEEAHEWTNLEREVVHEDDRVEKAVSAAIAIEREAAQNEIDTYKKSLEEIKKQLDEQNNELRLAKVTTKELSDKVSEFVSRLKECEKKAEKRGDKHAKEEAAENREQAVQVFADVSTLVSSVDRATDDNERAIQSTEDIEERGEDVNTSTKMTLLDQIRRGVQLKSVHAKTKEEKMNAQDDKTLAAVLYRAMAKRREQIRHTPMPESTSQWESTWDETEAKLALAQYYRVGHIRRPIKFISVHPSTLESLY